MKNSLILFLSFLAILCIACIPSVCRIIWCWRYGLSYVEIETESGKREWFGKDDDTGSLYKPNDDNRPIQVK